MTQLKKCTKCLQEKDIENFRQAKRLNKTYFKSWCKICETNNTKEYRKTHKQTHKQVNSKEYKKAWKIKNKDKLNEQYRDRYKNDINFRIRKNISRAIHRSLKSKNISMIKYLSWNMVDFKKHMEDKFDEFITWENYGSYWHIDHIIPQSCLPYTSMEDDNFKTCWALNNLRPLDAKTNLMDGATRVRHKLYYNFLMENQNG